MPATTGTPNTAALIGAAMPTQSWAQRRADRQQSVLLRGYLGQMKEQELQQEQAVGQQLEEQNQRLANLPILSPHQVKVNAIMDEFRKEIKNKVETQYNGDYKKYRDSELLTDAQKLSSKVLASPVIRQAQESKINFGMAREDTAKGDRVARPVTYTLSDGTVKTADWEEHYRDFNMGKVDVLQYSGAYKQPKEYANYFEKNYSPGARDKFQAVPVGAAEFYDALVTQDGLSPADARDYIKRAGFKDGSMYWKHDARDPYREMALNQNQYRLGQTDRQIAIAQQRADTAAAKAASAGSGEGGDKQIQAELFNKDNQIDRVDQVNMYYDPTVAKIGKDGKFPAAAKTETFRVYSDAAIGEGVYNQAFGLGKDGDKRPKMDGMIYMENAGSDGKVGFRGAVNANLKPNSYDIVSIKPGLYYGSGYDPKYPATPGNLAYKVVQVKMTGSQVKANGLSEWSIQGRKPNKVLQNDAVQVENNSWGRLDANEYTFDMYVPIDLNNKQNQAILQMSPLGKLQNQAKAIERQNNDFGNEPVIDVSPLDFLP